MAPSDSLPIREPHPIRAYRKRRGLSLETVALRARMSQAGLSRIENGGTELPTAAVIAKLAIACEGEVSEIDIFRWHFAAATGQVAPFRAPMTGDFTWAWVKKLPGQPASAAA